MQFPDFSKDHHNSPRIKYLLELNYLPNLCNEVLMAFLHANLSNLYNSMEIPRGESRAVEVV